MKTDAAAASSQGDGRLRVGHWRRAKGVRRHTRQPQEKRCNQNRRVSHILISQLAAVRCGPMQNSLRLNNPQPNAKTYCPRSFRTFAAPQRSLSGYEFCSIFASLAPSREVFWRCAIVGRRRLVEAPASNMVRLRPVARTSLAWIIAPLKALCLVARPPAAFWRGARTLVLATPVDHAKASGAAQSIAFLIISSSPAF